MEADTCFERWQVTQLLGSTNPHTRVNMLGLPCSIYVSPDVAKPFGEPSARVR